jgi:UDP-GlcNAc3NAcA epimerase
MTGRMLEAIERVLLIEKPDLALVYGDTNSTLAGALAASKLHIPIAHVEAGLRSFNMRMPEEINRILTDRISTYLLCPTQAAVKNLKLEGFKKGVSNVGDVMFDAALYFSERAMQQHTILNKLGFSKGEFLLVTCHRQENTDVKENLTTILNTLVKIARDIPVVFPIHPRTQDRINCYSLADKLQKLCVLAPVSYLDMVALEKAAKVILTDSGGIQKEAFFYGVPCVTMRDETEWVETVELGWNQIVELDEEKIYQAVLQAKRGCKDASPYGDGMASKRIVQTFLEPAYV